MVFFNIFRKFLFFFWYSIDPTRSNVQKNKNVCLNYFNRNLKLYKDWITELQKICKIVIRKFAIFSSSLIFKEKLFFNGSSGFNWTVYIFKQSWPNLISSNNQSNFRCLSERIYKVINLKSKVQLKKLKIIKYCNNSLFVACLSKFCKFTKKFSILLIFLIDKNVHNPSNENMIKWNIKF